ncbi:hypothetical protein [Namhaeicola litoreus]|uniref:Leucine-rich repeat domain-containing protein n=1 Tax=Namhaeicola litoreus TaxID=1052145 RepID=A0ABW3XXG1_9FLAO
MKKYFYLLTLSIFLFGSCEKEDDPIIDLSAEKQLPKIEVCHYDSDTDTWKTLSISENALNAHLKHGDKLGRCGYTYVPDDAFEQALIDFGYDDFLDNYVLTSNIADIKCFPKHLNNLGIADLTGIEDFKNLQILRVINNNIKSIDLSKNTMLKELYINNNRLQSLNLIKNKALRIVSCPKNELIDLNVTWLPELKEILFYDNSIKMVDLRKSNKLNIIVGYNNKLETILLPEEGLSGNASINLSYNLFRTFEAHGLSASGLSISNNPQLESVDISGCTIGNFSVNNCNLSYLNLRDIAGSFDPEVWRFAFLYTANNPNLTCISIDQNFFTQIRSYNIDPWTTFSEDCGY